MLELNIAGTGDGEQDFGEEGEIANFACFLLKAPELKCEWQAQRNKRQIDAVRKHNP